MNADKGGSWLNERRELTVLRRALREQRQSLRQLALDLSQDG